MKYEKSKSGSYICNCLLNNRVDSNKIKFQMDVTDEPDMVCLNGYAIIPKEEYYALKGEEMPQSERNAIKQAEVDLLI